MKKFGEVKKGDTVYLIDDKHDYQVKSLKVKKVNKYYDGNGYVVEGGERFCPENLSRFGLLCTEEKIATNFVEKVIKKKKLFATLKPGDTVYYANKKEVNYGKAIIIGVNIDGDLLIGNDKDAEEGTPLYFATTHELYSNIHRQKCYKIRCDEWKKGNYTELIFINEEDVKSYTEKTKKMLESKAIGKYIDSVSNQGKPISFLDNKGNQLHYGDKVAYVRRNGLHAHTDISFGIVTGESKTKIKILDEEELKVGKPNVDRWRRNEGDFIESDGLHALEPQNVVFISNVEKKFIEFNK